jgi:hypothetical protein
MYGERTFVIEKKKGGEKKKKREKKKQVIMYLSTSSNATLCSRSAAFAVLSSAIL